jgi:hypothetical protein
LGFRAEGWHNLVLFVFHFFLIVCQMTSADPFGVVLWPAAQCIAAHLLVNFFFTPEFFTLLLLRYFCHPFACTYYFAFHSLYSCVYFTELLYYCTCAAAHLLALLTVLLYFSLYYCTCAAAHLLVLFTLLFTLLTFQFTCAAH